MKKFKITIAIAACMLMLLPSAAAHAANYTIVKNDSIYKIGQLFKVPMSTIIQTNSLTTDLIYPGQVLQVPALEYTIKSGDTLIKIANRYHIALADLRQANHISNSLIKTGNILIIPGVMPESQTASSAGTTSKGQAGTSAQSTGTAKAVISYTNNELDLMARLIEAEASGESYQAKVAVGAVVINRVQSKEWAPTITEVIYQKYDKYYQFTPVQNGMINKPASDASIKAAKAALNGEDPSNGAIYFYDGSTTNQWMLSKTVTAHIDSLTFAK